MKIVVAIVAGVILLLGGLLGWSRGWFGGAADVPANASSQTVGKTALPTVGSDADKPLGNKRNKGIGE